MTDRCWCGGPVVQDRCSDSRFHDPFASGEPGRVTKLYVAGPMSGIKDCNYPEFNRVAHRLRTAGYTVVNPAEVHIDRLHHYVDLIREDLKLMLDCGGLAVLDRWWASTGARNEVNNAGILKMPVLSWEEWLRPEYLKQLDHSYIPGRAGACLVCFKEQGSAVHLVSSRRDT